MKKFIAIIMFIVGFAVYAQDSTVWVEGGYLPRTVEVNYPEKPNIFEEVLYIDLGINYNFFKYFYLGGNVMTYMVPHSDVVNFLPFYTFYSFTAAIKVDVFTVGFEHRCAHPVAAIAYVVDPMFPVDSAFDRLYVKMEVKF